MKTTIKELPKFNLVKEPTGIFHDNLAINSSRQAYELLLPFFQLNSYDIYESFFLLLMNRANKPIGVVLVSQGGLDSTVVDVRLVCKYAIEALAVSIIIAHNHPSSNRVASEQDKRITARTKEALNMFDIRLFDHIILCPENSYFSFADEGML